MTPVPGEAGRSSTLVASLLARLLDRRRNLARLAGAKADLPRAIAGDDNGREREVLAALHHLGDAVDMNDCFSKLGLSVHHLSNP